MSGFINKHQQRLKERVDAHIDTATERRGIVTAYTGNGKGKTTAGFGTVTRAVVMSYVPGGVVYKRPVT